MNNTKISKKVASNHAVLFTTLQHLCMLPLVTFLGEFRLVYETYDMRILFFVHWRILF